MSNVPKGVKIRKDRSLHPLNTDFDLYSLGADGRSVAPLTAKQSHDDIIRANNGGYYGYGEDY
jgi:general secretion pathway protein G